MPESVLALLRIPGVGPEEGRGPAQGAGHQDAGQLKAACEAGQVRELKGFGEKTEQIILQGMAIAEQASQRLYWAEADQIVAGAARALARLQERSSSSNSPAATAAARRRSAISTSSSSPPTPTRRWTAWRRFPRRRRCIARGDTKMSIRIASGLQIDLRVVPAESFGAALQYFTGSKEHNVILRGRAKDQGLKINE